MTKPSIVDWHRLFGMIVERDFLDYELLWTDREKDLSIKEQLLDVLIVYTDSMETLKSFLANPPKPLPDGLENLSQHNLITYKSFRESLNEWTLQELTGHYVNYRKNKAVKEDGDKYDKLLPENHFRLYAVCTRFPRDLMKKYKAKKRKEGVYDIVHGGLTMRIIVLRQIPQSEHNAIWNIFSNVVENIEYGALQYRPRLKTMSSVLDLLFEYYNLEGTHMAYTYEQFERDHFLRKVPKMLQDEETEPSFLATIFKTLSLDKLISSSLDDERSWQLSVPNIIARLLDDERLRQLSLPNIMARLSPKERLEGLSPDERLEGLSPDERLDGLSPDERLDGLSPDERLDGLSPDERLDGLSPDERLAGLSPDKRLDGLSPDERLEGLSPDERLDGLSPDEIKVYLQQIESKN